MDEKNFLDSVKETLDEIADQVLGDRELTLSITIHPKKKSIKRSKKVKNVHKTVENHE